MKRAERERAGGPARRLLAESPCRRGGSGGRRQERGGERAWLCEMLRGCQVVRPGHTLDSRAEGMTPRFRAQHCWSYLREEENKQNTVFGRRVGKINLSLVFLNSACLRGAGRGRRQTDRWAEECEDRSGLEIQIWGLSACPLWWKLWEPISPTGNDYKTRRLGGKSWGVPTRTG